jgi:hypothetical protein
MSWTALNLTPDGYQAGKAGVPQHVITPKVFSLHPHLRLEPAHLALARVKAGAGNGLPDLDAFRMRPEPFAGRGRQRDEGGARIDESVSFFAREQGIGSPTRIRFCPDHNVFRFHLAFRLLPKVRLAGAVTTALLLGDDAFKTGPLSGGEERFRVALKMVGKADGGACA